MKTEVSPSIYVADLAAYNSGRLHGVWIDATDNLDEMQEQIQAMLSKSPVPDSEEYAIHDYEGFGNLSIHEYEDIEKVHEYAVFISQYPVASDLLANFQDDIESARTALEEDYHGVYESAADFAQELTEETTTIPENLTFYIDYDSMARDMELSGDIFTIETGYHEVHVFWNR